MTQKKPDRWERMVKRRAEFENLWDGDAWLLGETVIKLLRKEHRAVVRLVQDEKRDIQALETKTRRSTDPRYIAIADCLKSRAVQCHDILDRLTRRAK